MKTVATMLVCMITGCLVAGLLAMDFKSANGQVATSVDTLTFHGDRTRIGWNSNETMLTPANVSGGSFGPVWNSPQFDSTTINGRVYPPHMYASPLYVDRVTINNPPVASGVFSVVFAATSTGWVYAVNAIDTPAAIGAGAILWRTHLGQASTGPDGLSVGVLSTPTIDLNASPPRIYVTADVNDTNGRSWRIFALDLGSGAVLSGWPLIINNTTLAPINQNGPTFWGGTAAMSQRGALNLSPDGHLLYVPLGAYGDGAPGWMLSVDTVTPALASAFAGAPSMTTFANAGMWGAGGPSVDGAGYVYESTGNSPSGSGPAPHVWGQSILKFNPGTPLSLAGTYTPWNYCQMDQNDVDLSGGSPILLPDYTGAGSSTPNLVANGGKQGNAYLLNRDLFAGRLDQRPACNTDPTNGPPTDTSLLGPTGYSYYNGSSGPLNIFGPYSENSNQSDLAKARSTPAFFHAADGSNYVFFSGSTKTGINQRSVMPPSLIRVKVIAPSSQPAYFVFDAGDTVVKALSPGSPVVTSDGSANPIVWLTDANVYRSATLAGPHVPHPVLYAFDALTMNLLWSSTSSMLNVAGKYSHPTIARGIVFVGTDRIQAFGLTTPHGASDRRLTHP